MSSLVNFLAALMFYISDFPQGQTISAIMFLAGGMYLFLFAFFNQIYFVFPRSYGIIMSAVGIVMLTSAVHFSGGIVSPLVFIYFCILVSETIYGLENQTSLILAASGYLFVTLGESFGLITPANDWAVTVYSSHAATFIFVSATIFFMWMTRYMSHFILVNLRTSLERQNVEKEMLLSKFSELNGAAQIGVLAHRIVHDLRGPMSSISGYIQIEMLRASDPENKAMLKDLDDVVISMSESLKSITQFGKVTDAKAEKILLADFMRTLIAIVSYSPQARGVKFVKHYAEDLPLAINASRADLQQAYFNIIRNAIEAIRDNAGPRVIEISMKAVEKEAEVSISDNGPGMDPEVLKNLFRRSVTTKRDGTGVGLVITRDLLTRNDGFIEFQNLPTGGLWVVTRFPLV